MRQRQNLTVKVYRHLLDRLLNSQLVAGQRLVFADLARDFKVSRTPVSNALSILASQGYLDLYPNRGYLVHSYSNNEIHDLLELKSILEFSLLGKAVIRAEERDLEQLQRCQLNGSNALANNRIRCYARYDVEFHVTILDLAGCHSGTEMYREVMQKLAVAAVNQDHPFPPQDALEQDHEEILAAIRHKDVNLTIQRSCQHQPLRLRQKPAQRCSPKDRTYPLPVSVEPPAD
jgi:DNA-binding GntR family transcriptional regulator